MRSRTYAFDDDPPQVEVSMKAMQRVSMVAAVAAMVGCTAEMHEPEVSQSVHEIGVVECQVELAECTLSARGILARSRCATQYTSCTSQAAIDLLVGQDLLAECRSDANVCLEGVLTLDHIGACRSLYGSCAEDLINTVDESVRNAVDAARDVIDETVGVAIDTVGAATGAVDGALSAVEACRSEAFDCLENVATLNNVSDCRSVFSVCTEEAVSSVEGVIDVLPIPAPGQVIETLDECRAASEDCLEGALSVTDISVCRGTLETCVKGVTDVASDVAGEFDDLVGILPLPVPPPSEVIDCSAELSLCLLSLKSPFVCAREARECANL
jgi:hypothetical protein